jgi:chromosome partitioning protein
MKTIAITNEKGGVGKSTIAAHWAAGQAIRGKNVCLIDTDPQGHAARLLGMPEEDGLYKLLVDNADWRDVLRLVPPERYSVPDQPAAGKLFLLPGSTRTAVLASLIQDPFTLDDRLKELGDQFDFGLCFLDTAPTASMFDSTIYFAAGAFLYVTLCEALSFDGIRKSLAKIERFGLKRAEYGQNANHLLGIVPNMFRARTTNHRMNLENLAAAFPGQVWKPVAERTKWTEASNYGKLIFAYAPTSGEAHDAWELIDQAEGALAAWAIV